MTVKENKWLVRQYYESVVSTGDVSAIAEFIGPDYVEVYNGTRHPLGIAGATNHVRGARETYPDLRLNILQQIGEGEWVVTRLIATGTHQGEWLGMKPTGKKIEIATVNIDRVVDGKIVEHGGAANLLEPLLQIGAIKIADPLERF